MEVWQKATSGTVLLLMAVTTAGVIWEKVSERSDAKRYPPPGRLIDVGGRRLHLRCEGSGPGPTVLMVAGGGAPSVVSYALQDRIAAFAKVCSYDRPGLGWSDPAREPMSLDDHVADVERLLANGGVTGPLVLAPESFGALIALGYAEKHPERMAAIVFIDGAEPETWFQTMRGVSPFRSRLTEDFIQLGWRTGVIRLLLPMLTPNWVAALPAQNCGQFRAIYSRSNPGYGEALVAFERTPLNGRPIVRPGLLGSIPIVVIQHGKPSGKMGSAFEAVWPKAQSRLAALTTTQPMVVVADGSGHAIAEEQPERVAKLVRTAIESSSLRGP